MPGDETNLFINPHPSSLNQSSENNNDERNLTQSSISKPISILLDRYCSQLKSPKLGTTPIHVDEIASHVAKFYELIRKVVDWKDDNALRRAAIERILKRLLFSRLSGFTLAGHIDIGPLAETLTLDLIRGGHLPNDQVPQEKVELISAALAKYVHFIEHAPFVSPDPLIVKRRINYLTFIIELASCEVEEILTEPFIENSLIIAMTEAMLERINLIPPEALSPDEKFVQTYVSVCRTLYDFDNSYFAYHLLILQFPEWKTASGEFTTRMNTQLPGIWEQLPKILSHPLGNKFYAHSDRIDTIFVLLEDILKEFQKMPNNIKPFFSNKSELLRRAEEFYNKRYSTLKKRLLSLAVFSTLSVFASNWITYFLVEVPLARVFAEGFNIFTAFIDFLVPTVIMFLLVVIIRPPNQVNRERVLETLSSFVYETNTRTFYEIRAKPRRRPIMRFLTGTVSLLITVFVLGLTAWIFWIAGLPITSVVFDTFTIALTVFAAVTIRNKSKELTVGEPSSVMEFFLDMISVPVARVGSFLASKWKDYNIVAFVFTFIIETPLLKIVDVIEQWSQFLKERRAEIR